MMTRIFLICFALLTSTVFFSGLKSAHGQAAQEYIVDTLVVVDDLMYNSWRSLYPSATSEAEINNAITQYVSLAVHQANKRLATINQHTSFSLKMQVVAIQINKDVLQFVLTSLLTKRANVDQALDVFSQWVVDEGLTGYDHAMLLTGKELETSDGAPAAGRAYVGQICSSSGSSVSVVQDKGGFQSVYFVAHEMGHSLGAVHDGETGAESCSEADQYLMAAASYQTVDQSGTSGNAWYMSVCSATSINDIVGVVTSSSSNCLGQNQSPLAEFTAAADIIAGQVYNVTEQCRMIEGSSSNICLGDSFPSIDQICTSMFCATESGGTCSQYIAAEGTSCGDKMWCDMGRCLASDAAPVLGECPFGDTAKAPGGYPSCTEYINSVPMACYTDDVREGCCQSCSEVYTNNDACPYGDRRSGCGSDLCTQIDVDGTVLAQLCCSTCNYESSWLCQDADSIDGFTCQERTTAYSIQECYNATVAYYCCQTCAEQRISQTGCEYGDRVLGPYCEAEARSDNSGCTGNIDTVCCKTCSSQQSTSDPDKANLSTSSWTLIILVTFISIIIANCD